MMRLSCLWFFLISTTFAHPTFLSERFGFRLPFRFRGNSYNREHHRDLNHPHGFSDPDHAECNHHYIPDGPFEIDSYFDENYFNQGNQANDEKKELQPTDGSYFDQGNQANDEKKELQPTDGSYFDKRNQTNDGKKELQPTDGSYFNKGNQANDEKKELQLTDGSYFDQGNQTNNEKKELQPTYSVYEEIIDDVPISNVNSFEGVRSEGGKAIIGTDGSMNRKVGSFLPVVTTEKEITESVPNVDVRLGFISNSEETGAVTF